MSKVISIKLATKEARLFRALQAIVTKSGDPKALLFANHEYVFASEEHVLVAVKRPVFAGTLSGYHLEMFLTQDHKPRALSLRRDVLWHATSVETRETRVLRERMERVLAIFKEVAPASLDAPLCFDPVLLARALACASNARALTIAPAELSGVSVALCTTPERNFVAIFSLLRVVQISHA